MLGFRALLDVIPLDASLVRGSHGRITESRDDGPLLVSRRKELIPQEPIDARDVFSLILSHIFQGRAERIAERAPAASGEATT